MQKVGCFLGKYKSTTVFFLFSTDGNGRGTNGHSWCKPTTSRLFDYDQQVMETSNRSQTSNHPARCGRKQLHMVSMRISMEQSLKCRIEWPKDIKSDAFARRTVSASDSTCSADGVSLALTSTLLLIPDSFCAGAKTTQDRASVHTWEQWFLFGAISVTERNCAAPIPRVESELHIG